MGVVGAALDNLTTVTTASGTAGTAATDAATLATQQAEAVRQEVQDVADVLLGDFNRTNEALLGVVDRTNTELGAAGWAGTSPEVAQAAAAEFRTDLSTIGTNATTAIETFRTSAMAEAEAINQTIGVELNRILNQLNTTLATFGAQVSSYSTSLNDIDASSIRRTY